MSEKQPITKKQIAQNFLKLTEKGEVREAFDLYVAKSFKHHNPRFIGDRETMITVMEKTAREFPDLAAKRIRTLVDGNFIAVHSHIQPLPGNKSDDGLTYMHIFRFSNGKIAELWDFGQPVPVNMANENGMF